MASDTPYSCSEMEYFCNNGYMQYLYRFTFTVSGQKLLTKTATAQNIVYSRSQKQNTVIGLFYNNERSVFLREIIF